MVVLGSLLAILSISLLVKFLLYMKWKTKVDKISENFDGPKGLPFIGVGVDLMKAGSLFDYRDQVYKIFSSPIKAWFGPLHLVILISDPASAKKVLTSYETLDKSVFYKFFQLDTTIFSNPKEKWRHQRKCTNALLLNRKYSETCYPTVVRTAEKFAQSLMTKVDGPDFDIFNYIGAYVVELVFKVFFDCDYDALTNPEENEIIIKTERTNETNCKRLITLPYHLDIIYKFSKLYKIGKENNLDAFYENLIQEKMDDLLSPANQTNPNGGLARILLKPEDYNHIECRDSFKGVVFASFDTTSSMLSKTLLLLATHPEAQDELFKEICVSVINDEDVYDQTIIKNMIYLDLVCKEALRIFPPVPFLARCTSEDFKLSDYQTIPTGTNIIIDVFKMHRHTEYWGEDADKFVPERFLPERIKNIDMNAYLPFSAGSRNCQGYLFAEMFYKVALVKIIKNFYVTTEVKIDDLEFEFSLTLKFKQDTKISLKKRKN